MFVRFSTFDGGCRANLEARFLSVIKVLDLLVWHLLRFWIKRCSVLFPPQNMEGSYFVSEQSKSVEFVGTEESNEYYFSFYQTYIYI